MKIKIFILSILLLAGSSLFSRGHAPGWYTGALLSPSASNVPAGETCISPFILATQSKPGHVDQTSLNSFNILQYGLTTWLDLSITFQGVYSHQKGINSAQWGDIFTKFGIQLLREDPDTWTPNMRLGILESFPTGRFHKLNPSNNGVDSNGSGAYETHFDIAFSKEFFIFENHPLLLRIFFDYFFNTFAHVSGFHLFGGGFNTSGKVRPPRIFITDFSFEYHLSKNIVYAMDVLYSHATASKFTGDPGTNPDGTIATNTIPKATQVSLAPALEYNFTPDFGLIGGVWFNLNGAYFLTYMFSVTYTF